MSNLTVLFDRSLSFKETKNGEDPQGTSDFDDIYVS